jgi:hypothetical protein
VLNIYMNKEIKGTWDLKVKDELIRTWITDGIDPARKVRVTVSERNFRNRDRGTGERGERGDRRGGRGGGRGGDRGDRGDRRGGRGGRGGGRGGDRERNENGEEKKKVYVDKVTGKAPTNKTDIEKQIIEEKSRILLLK